MPLLSQDMFQWLVSDAAIVDSCKKGQNESRLHTHRPRIGYNSHVVKIHTEMTYSRFVAELLCLVTHTMQRQKQAMIHQFQGYIPFLSFLLLRSCKFRKQLTYVDIHIDRFSASV